MKSSLAIFVVLLAAVADTGSSVTIVPRSQWRARPAKGGQKGIASPTRVFVHHTVTPTCNSEATCAVQLRSMQNDHMNRQGWRDIGYSFLIGGDGKAYEGRGWNAEGAHTPGFNRLAYGVSFIGNFEVQTPNAAMLKAFNELMAFAVSKKYLKDAYKVNGHRDATATACPGKNLYNLIRTWPRYDKSFKRAG